MPSWAGDCRRMDRRGWRASPESRFEGDVARCAIRGPRGAVVPGWRVDEVLAFAGLMERDESGVRNDEELARPVLGVRRWSAGRTADGGGFWISKRVNGGLLHGERGCDERTVGGTSTPTTLTWLGFMNTP